MGKKIPTSHIAKKKGIPRKLPGDQEDLLFSHQRYMDVYHGRVSGDKVNYPTIAATRTLGLYTGIQVKAGLSRLDDKSYWINAAARLSYGHYMIAELEMMQVDADPDMALVERTLQECWMKELQDSVALEEKRLRAMEEAAFYDREVDKMVYSALPDYSVMDRFIAQWLDV
jgi:hypothetical protein